MRLHEYLEMQKRNERLLKEGVEQDYCDRCYTTITGGELDSFENLYGETLCEDCWDEYMNTTEALVEYIPWIANGEATPEDFSEDELKAMVDS